MNFTKALNNFLNYNLVPLVQPLNMIQAAYRNNVKIMERIYKENPTEINTRYKESENSALHIAAKKGNLEAVEFLLKNGAVSSHKNKDGLTALDFALKYDQTTVQDLLENNTLELIGELQYFTINLS